VNKRKNHNAVGKKFLSSPGRREKSGGKKTRQGGSPDFEGKRTGGTETKDEEGKILLGGSCRKPYWEGTIAVGGG